MMRPSQPALAKNVLCVMLTHNGLHMTKEAILSVLALDYPEDRVSLLVIDNASTDSTVAFLRSQRGYSTTYFSQQRSVAACWNYALEYAFAKPYPAYDAVCMLNNDILLKPDTLKWLVAAGEPFVTPISVRTEKELGKVGTAPTTKRESPDFACFLISKEVWHRVGRFDEGFEIAHCEDNDYHVRMHYAGIKAICLDLPFVHYGSSTVKQADHAEQRKIQRAADRNRKRFAEMYGCEVGSPEYQAIFES